MQPPLSSVPAAEKPPKSPLERLCVNALSLGIVQAANIALPLLSLPYLASVLGIQGLGRMAFAVAVAQVCLMLTDYGFNLSAARSVAIHRDSPDQVAAIWCAVTSIRVALCLVGLLVLFAGACVFGRIRNEFSLILVAYTMVIGNVLYPQWLFQGMENMKIVSGIQLLARVLAFCLLFAVVRTNADLHIATFVQCSGYLIGAVLALPLTVKALGGGIIRMPSANDLRVVLVDGWNVFISSAAVNAYTNSNAFFLGFIVTPSDLGQFHVAERLIRATQSAYAPISNAVFPYVSRLACQNVELALVFNKRLLTWLSMAAGTLALAVWAAGPFVITKIFGTDYSHSSGVIRIMAILPMCVVVSNVLGVQTMLAVGLEAQFSRILIFAAIGNFLVFVPAAYCFSITGAAWVNVAVEVFVAAAMAVALQRAGLNPMSRNRKFA